ncbi:biotin/lipoyl-containing protein [Nocardioides sp.]|uniref:biotin/lipoyl-containing protein n=1 Tax=Nocardioides sp. TaxID=35761 RepID=UPI003526DF9C
MSDFTMPSLGADMDQGTVIEWLVAPGDVVHKGDPMAVVDTSKSAIEVEAFAEGVVADLVVPVGTLVPVGTVLAHLTPLDAAPAPVPQQPAAHVPLPAEPEPATAAPSTPAPVSTPAPAPAVHSPLVRRRARELGVDLTSSWAPVPAARSPAPTSRRPSCPPPRGDA